MASPLYHQVKTLLLQEIEAGRWKPDDRLPPENELIRRFHVSRITVRHALRELEQLGYIRREQGRGTFVQRPAVDLGPRELTSFTDELRRHGQTATSHVLERGTIAADASIAGKLEVAVGEPVFRLRRLRLADGEPMGVQTAFIPLRLVPGITDIRFEGASLYQVLSERYSLFPSHAHETHAAVPMSREDALALGLAPGTPALAGERIAYLADRRPLEYVQSVMRGDRYKIVLDLMKQPGTPF